MLFIILMVSHLYLKSNKNFNLIIKTKLDSNDSSVNKIRFYINLIDKSFNYLIFTIAFILSFGFLSMNSSIIYLLTFGIAWSMLFGLFEVMTVAIYNWNLVYFLLFCYYSKFLVQLENKRLNSLITSKKLINNSIVIKTLSNFDVIYGKVMALSDTGLYSYLLAGLVGHFWKINY